MTAPPMLAPAPTVPQKMDPPATAPGKKEGAAPGKTSQRAAPQTVIPTGGPRLLVPLATSGSPF